MLFSKTKNAHFVTERRKFAALTCRRVVRGGNTMKRIKRTLAALLIVVLTLALLGEAVFADNSEQPVWPEEGAIQLSKSAAAVEGKENTWEVTLGIQGKNYKTTSDVVLVIDNSNSMYPSETSKEDRMTKTKAAANAFVDTLLTEDSTTRIALVVYNLKETHTGFYTYGNRAELKQQHLEERE